MKDTTEKLASTQTKVKLARRKSGVLPGYPLEFNDEFKRYIRKRDHFTCAVCEEYNKVLNVHHIDYIKKNTTNYNCIALCRDCHFMIHFQCTWVQRVIWKYKLWEIVAKREMFRE